MGSLVLGTVQLGMLYGVANTSGKPDSVTTTEIVRIAFEGGIREFDTAQEYGQSEQALGAAFKELGIAREVRVISKLRKDLDLSDVGKVVGSVKESLAKLGVAKLYGLLLHKEELLDQLQNNTPQGLRTVMDQGLAQHIGISVYTPKYAIQALETEGTDIVQLPTNMLDRRFERAGVFALAKKKGKQIYIRSVFLQGLLLMEPEALPSRMNFARSTLTKLATLSQESGLSKHAIALGYLKAQFFEANVILGAELPIQVKENIVQWNQVIPPSLIPHIQSLFTDIDEKILNPALWDV